MNCDYHRTFETQFASEALKELAKEFREKSKKSNKKNNKFKRVSRVYSIKQNGSVTASTSGCNQKIERICE